MSFDTMVYAHDASGKLLKFNATGVESYAQAIDLAKSAGKVARALCSVATQPAKQETA